MCIRDRPVDNVFGSPVLLDDILKKTDLVNPIVVSPDIGGVVRARAVAKLLNDTEMAIIDKRRPRAVSYTHLDVYKRQSLLILFFLINFNCLNIQIILYKSRSFSCISL